MQDEPVRAARSSGVRAGVGPGRYLEAGGDGESVGKRLAKRRTGLGSGIGGARSSSASLWKERTAAAPKNGSPDCARRIDERGGNARPDGPGESLHTEILAADHDSAVARAVETLRAGKLVALPTETVYGLAADASNSEAVAQIFAVKERPKFDPLIVHLPGAEWLERVARIPAEDRPLIEKLISSFWPGPFTIVLPRRAIIPDLVTAGLDTV